MNERIKELWADLPWDLICNRCGECCYRRKYREDGTVEHTGEPCPYLEAGPEGTGYKLCTTYHNRPDFCFKLTADMVKEGWLPINCAYRKVVT
jgi:uncharacterized protein